MMRLCAMLVICLLGGLLSVQAQAVAPNPKWSVGFHRLVFLDPLDKQPMEAIAFYPSNAPEHSTTLDGYKVEATEEADVAIGRFPMLMVSHGNYGTPLALRDVATSLARQGFVVVAVIHPGDNYRDHSRTGKVSNLYGRPMQISAAITASLADPMLSAYVDAKRVGVVGYSAGGETALILAGAQPDFERLRNYCRRYPSDDDACTTGGELVPDRADLKPMADPRVHALVLMAPLALMFGRHGLAEVHVPVLLYSGAADQLLLVEQNAGALARKLPQTPSYHLLDGAGHFVFMAPCDDEERVASPGLCTDARGVDRVGIHRDMNAEAARFFATTLGSAHYGMQTASQQ